MAICVAPILAFVVKVVATNLLANPGFELWENDSTPQSWRVESRTLTSVRRESDTVYSGNVAARLTRLVSGSGNNRGLLQRVAVTQAQNYNYSVWCWDNSDQVALGIFITWRSPDSGYIGSEPVRYSADRSHWQLIADSATAPHGAAFADFIIRTYDQNNAPAGNRVFADNAWFGPDSPQPETVSVWFTPDSLGQRLCDFLDRATSSIDYCCYNSSRPDVTNALIRAHNRGVRVRVVTDNTRLDDQWVQQLRANGIVVWSDSIGPNSSLYMHNKFVIRDLADSDSTNDWLWTGSYNPNMNETNADCALEIPNTRLARAYLMEFQQMWGGGGLLPKPESSRFHNAKSDRLVSHEFLVNGHPAYLFFGPQDGIVDTITAFTSRAQRLVLFAINSFTYDALAQAMIGRWNAGVTVAGTFDKAGASEPGSEYPRLRQWHIPVLIDSVPYGAGMLHEKVMVIDSFLTITGSANWSANANNSNDENTLILTDPKIARRFLSEIVNRYLEAGGTYPPGIIDKGGSAVPSGSRRASPVRLRRRSFGIGLYDVLGRFHPAQTLLAPGVYFLKEGKAPANPIVLIH